MTETKLRSVPKQAFSLGIVASSALEAAAVRCLFDEAYALRASEEAAPDENNYCFGRIGLHRVVLTWLPSGAAGSTSCAICVRDMRSSFPLIQDFALVGLAGGIPTAKRDIRLGDVVESHFDGVIPLAFSDGKWAKIDTAAPPSRWLLGAVSSEHSEALLEGSRVMQYLASVTAKAADQKTFARPDLDVLFHADSKHVPSDGECSGCLEQGVAVERIDRKRPDVVVHAGNIGSTPVAVVNAQDRDRLASQFDIVALDCESHGVAASSLRYLVIRGIASYCDSHASACAARWSGFASASAAAYLKSLLLSARPITAKLNIPGASPPLLLVSRACVMQTVKLRHRESSKSCCPASFRSHLLVVSGCFPSFAAGSKTLLAHPCCSSRAILELANRPLLLS